MSVLLEAPIIRTNFTKSTYGVSKTYYIILISAAITIASILLICAGLSYTEGMIKDYSDCRNKIIGFEQHGMYPSPELFKVALSYCDVR